MAALISMPVGHPCGAYIGIFIAMSNSIGVDDDTAQVLLSGRASPAQSERTKELMVFAARQLTSLPALGHG